MTPLPEPLCDRDSGGVPTGVVTFVFTDIEGSTERWDRYPTAMAAAVRRHDALVRAAIVANGGYVFKTLGDAFCAAFQRPEDAIVAMLDAREALAAEDFSAVDGIRIRAAIHSGTADEREGDYFGPVVNRVARLVAIGHGGQVLVSGTTAALVGAGIPSRATLRDLGEHRLKDLTQSENVYQLDASEDARDFPPLRSLDVLYNNLPLQITSFVGRETEVADVAALLAEHRLVTLVGSGGVGKTRTSLQVAAELASTPKYGVWFVELAPVSNGDYLPATVAQAMGISLPPGGESLANLVRALHKTNALLVFDNCEHVIDAASRVIAEVLRRCPDLRILASSRQALGIAGEATYRMPSLGFPTEGQTGTLTAAAAIEFPAIALFVARATAADHRFALDDENAPAVAEITRRLDGIPLALELAAARVKILRPRQIRDRLGERFRVLTGGSRAALPRQQTLRALIDWSHDLLDAREQTLFRRLGIFAGDFVLDAATAVGSGDGLDDVECFDVLASLVDKSLVLAEPDGDAFRYRLLESTREYARERLDAAGEREATATRHLHSLRDRFVTAFERYQRTARSDEIVSLLGAELEDVRAALQFSLDHEDEVTSGAELLAAIGTSWNAFARDADGIARLEAFVDSLDERQTELRSELLNALSRLLSDAGQRAKAMDLAVEAVALARAGSRPNVLIQAIESHVISLGRARRIEEADRALAEAEAIPEPCALLRLRLLSTRSFLNLFLGDLEGAATAYERLLREHRKIGNAHFARTITLSLAEVEHARGFTERSVALLRDVVPETRAGGDRGMFATMLANFAGYLVAVNETAAAIDVAREAIREVAARDPESYNLAVSAEHLALALALEGDCERAARLSGYADATFTRAGFEREFTETTTYDRLRGILRAALGKDRLAPLLAEGAALSPEGAIALALADS
jgi:predicted ATPase/class 3 adenylate cyclase